MQSDESLMPVNHEHLGEQLVDIVSALNDKILTYYEAPATWSPQRKADDSPVTEADLMAHQYLEANLSDVLPGVPYLSEEGGAISWGGRQEWPRYWLVDPLDGTQEFINRSDEFSVNVALIEDGQPVLGVVSLPVTGQVYVGIPGQGAYCWQQGERRALSPLAPPAPSVEPVLAVSRRRPGSNAKALAAALETEAKWCQMGGALKFCEIAEGRAHIYPRFSPVCEWDVAAGHALIESLGAQVYHRSGEPLKYNLAATLQDVYFCACAPGLAETVLPCWLGILGE